MENSMLFGVLGMGLLVSASVFAGTVTKSVSFHGLNTAQAVEYNGSPDTKSGDVDYCRSHNPVANQLVIIRYAIDAYKNGQATVTSYPEKPVLYPEGLSDKIAFMSDGKFRNGITRIIFIMDNDQKHPLTEWMTDPAGKSFQCVYSSLKSSAGENFGKIKIKSTA